VRMEADLDHDVLVLVPADALVVVDDGDEDLVEHVRPRLPEGVVRLAPARHQPHFSLMYKEYTVQCTHVCHAFFRLLIFAISGFLYIFMDLVLDPH
jgi:hypothetical protein